MFTTIMHAQSIGQPEMLRQTLTPVEKQEPLKHHGGADKTQKAPAVAKSHIDLRDNEVWWGYFHGNYKTSDPFDMLKTGYGTKITYACGIRLKAENDFDMGKGKTIEGIKFVFPDLKHIEDVKIWMSTSLSELKDMSDCDICVQNIDKADLIDAMHGTEDDFTNEIRFDTPYTIGDEDVYIGYTFRVTDVEDIYDQCPVVLDENPENILSTDGAFFWRYDDDDEWYEETDGEVIAMQVLFSGGDIKQNAVNIKENFQDVAMQKNTMEVLPLELSTIGKQGLKSFKYVTKSADKVIDEQTVTLDEPIEAMGGKYVHEFQLTSGDEAGVSHHHRDHGGERRGERGPLQDGCWRRYRGQQCAGAQGLHRGLHRHLGAWLCLRLRQQGKTEGEVWRQTGHRLHPRRQAGPDVQRGL